MPLRSDKEGWFLIQRVVKQGIGFFLNKAYPRVEDKIMERVENDDWRRETTPQIREQLHESLGGYHPDVRKDMDKDQSANAADKLAMLIDVFVWVYDADDAYAMMFHNFLDRVRNGDVPGQQGERHLADPDRRDWRERENMKGEDADYGMDEFETRYYDVTEEVLE